VWATAYSNPNGVDIPVKTRYANKNANFAGFIVRA